jgi:hypothetical protein
MTTDYAQGLERMSALYRDYAHRLVDWFTWAEEGRDVDELLGCLSAIEAEFFEAAREIGDRIEEERQKESRRCGTNLTLWRMARDGDLIASFDAASAAVAEVAKLRTKALREVERIRDGIVLESDKMTGARRAVKGYNPGGREGRNVDGKA